jgi:hypothetical protein
LTVNGSATITNGTHSGTNTGDQTSIVGITGTKAQFDTAVTDGNILYVGDVTTNATHTGDATGSGALTVVALNGTSLAGLATGILKNTTGTGVPSIAINSDLPVMSATVGGAVPTPPNNTTTFLRGDGTFATPTATVADPSYSPGSFTVATETYKLLGNHIKLTTTQRITVAGTGRLRISN